MLFWNFVIILILITLNAFFVSVEFAVVTSRKSRIELLAEQGNQAAQIVKRWLENPSGRDRLIAASQLGITAVSLALGSAGEKAFEAVLEPYFEKLILPANLQNLGAVMAALPLTISLILVTGLHVVLGEQVPKVAALHDPESFAMVAARPMQIFTRIFKWFIDLLDWITRQILSMVGLRMVGEHALVYSVEELKQILTESEEGGVIEAPAREMMDAIFDLDELLIRQVMIPRTEILAIEADMVLPEVLQLVTQTSYTKLPVYEDDLDQVVGILHVKDLVRSLMQDRQQPLTARTIMREAVFVPETLSVTGVLQQFRKDRQHIAIVLDEYGGTAGLVTLEDLLEEIVGEVSDPFDQNTPQFETRADGTIIIDGLALIEEVNQQLGLNLQDPDYDTIAGYMLGALGRIPRVGDILEKEGLNLRVESMDGMRIASICLLQKPAPGTPAESTSN
ncbi:MAG: hemolysin family protein [Anaerolineales bacterium]|jgi:CBS domain containing-hemolysin-like protein|nr:hemolysin family protein [Anaerolineales bacterium]